MPRTIEGDLRGDGLRVAVLVSVWNAAVTDRLKVGALEVLARAGVADDDVVVIEVPGAFELPQAAAAIADGDSYDAIIALGCLVHGCAKGLMDVSLSARIPVAFGVITADTQAQADARSRTDAPAGKGGHKGREAAEAAVRLANAMRRFEEDPS